MIKFVFIVWLTLIAVIWIARPAPTTVPEPQPVIQLTSSHDYSDCHATVSIEYNQKQGDDMSIDKGQLRQLIREVLLEVDLHSASAEELLMMTAATESHLGKYLTQDGGPAAGIFQMEPSTEEDIWDSYLAYRNTLSDKVIDTIGGGGLSEFDLRANLTYQIIMARLQYLRVKAPLPEATDIPGMAGYWKDHYNTRSGKGTVEKAIESYEYYVVEG